jgi:amino-acid N-acetyltransferase
MSNEAIIHVATGTDYPSAKTLLQKNNLPTDDIPTELPHFFVVKDNGVLIGTIGLECYGSCGLLRSMATDINYRNRGIASALVAELLRYAKRLGLMEIYLLTETAADYFERKGFKRIDRNEAPDEIRASAEFSHVCPSTAVLMKKEIA